MITAEDAARVVVLTEAFWNADVATDRFKALFIGKDEAPRVS